MRMHLTRFLDSSQSQEPNRWWLDMSSRRGEDRYGVYWSRMRHCFCHQESDWPVACRYFSTEGLRSSSPMERAHVVLLNPLLLLSPMLMLERKWSCCESIHIRSIVAPVFCAEAEKRSRRFGFFEAHIYRMIRLAFTR